MALKSNTHASAAASPAVGATQSSTIKEALKRIQEQQRSGLLPPSLTVFDFETTHLGYREGVGHPRPVEIAAVRIESGKPMKSFLTLVNPGIPIDPGAQAVHNISPKMVAGAPGVSESVRKLQAFSQGSALVAHNAPFDTGILERELQKAGSPLKHTTIIDTLRLSREAYDVPNYKLGTLATEFGFQTPTHRAMADVLTTTQLLSKLSSEHGGMEGLQSLTSGGGIFTRGVKAAELEGGVRSKLLSSAGALKWGKRAGAVAAGGLAAYVLGRALFSGRDDNYNTIEGLPHGGVSEYYRKQLTDFGSGYQGLLHSVARFSQKHPFVVGGTALGATIGVAALRSRLHEKSIVELKYRSFLRTQESSDELHDPSLTRARFSFFQKALPKYGTKTGTGHKRILIPEEILSRQDIESTLGFVPVNIAVPESGQTEIVSYRHPKNTYHLHKHEKMWTMHQDRHVASTMLAHNYKEEVLKKGREPSLLKTMQYTFEGLPHVLEEGVPGMFYWMRGLITNSPDMAARVWSELPKKYWAELNRVRGNRISGKDDDYNTIRGLPHGGMAQRKRRELTDFGSGYQGLARKTQREQEESKRRNSTIGAIASTAAGLGVFTAARRLQPTVLNKPVSVEDYTRRFTKDALQPGDIVWSRNIAYEGPFHSAVVGADEFVYEAFMENKALTVKKHSKTQYVREQIAHHAQQGEPFGLYGISRDQSITKQQRAAIAGYLEDFYQKVQKGKDVPSYGMRANDPVNSINCLSLAAEAHKQAGKEFFKPGTRFAYPWNVRMENQRWIARGPEYLPSRLISRTVRTGIGAVALGAGVAQQDPLLMGYGALSLGMSALRTDKQIARYGKLPALFLGKRWNAVGLPMLAGLSVVTPFTRIVSNLNLEQRSKKVSQFSDAVGDNVMGVAAMGAAAHLGYTSWKAIRNVPQYDPKSKRFLILADTPKGGAKGHWTPSLAVKSWLEKEGYEADVIEGLADLGQLRRAGKKYRMFIDSGYKAQWVSGMPGMSMQWDIIGEKNARSGVFRWHHRKYLGMSSPGMIYAVPDEREASLLRNATGASVHSFGGLAVRPEVVAQMKATRRALAQGRLRLPAISSNQPFITISGGGKGFGVAEAAQALMESGHLQRTNTRAVVFAGHIAEQRPEAAQALKKLVASNPELFTLFDLADKNGPGYRLPEYMAASKLNIFAGGASTVAEGILAGRPMIGFTGGGVPDWPHFRENPLFAQRKYGIPADTIDLPEMGQSFQSAGKSLGEKIDSLLSTPYRARPIVEEEWNVGKRLLSVVQQAEETGGLRPAKWRGSIEGLLLPLWAQKGKLGSSLFVGGVLVGAAGLIKMVGSTRKDATSLRSNKPLRAISGKDDTYNTIEGLARGGMAERSRRQMTDFGSGYQWQNKQDTKFSWGAAAIGGAAAGTVGYLGLFPWTARGIDLAAYPRLARLRKAARFGVRMVSAGGRTLEDIGPLSIATARERAIFALTYGELRPSKMRNLHGFKGLVYIQSGEYANLPLSPSYANLGEWAIGADKLDTWEYLNKKGVGDLHAPTIAGADFYNRENGTIKGLSPRAQAFIKQHGGLENLVLKARSGARGEGVWMNLSTLPGDIADRFFRSPEEFLVQAKLDLADEFRVVTVGDKAVHATYRYGSPRVRKFAKALGYESVAIKATGKVGRVSPFEVVQPVFGETHKRLVAFAERASREMPYDIGAFDIGMTKAGEFKVIEAQRSFGNVSNPIVARRIRQVLTGKMGVGAAVGVGVLAAAGAIFAGRLFSGKDDAYNTIEGLRHGGMAQKGRRKLTPFGSGYDLARGMAQMLGMSYDSFLSSKVFQGALARGRVVKRLGEGIAGFADLMETKVGGWRVPFTNRVIGGKSFQYVRKTLRPFEQTVDQLYANSVKADPRVTRDFIASMAPKFRDLAKEGRALTTLRDTALVPTSYGHVGDSLYMELMPGSPLRSYTPKNLPNDLLRHVDEVIEEAASKGLANPDIHSGNILYDFKTKRVSWLDWGAVSEHDVPRTTRAREFLISQMKKDRRYQGLVRRLPKPLNMGTAQMVGTVDVKPRANRRTQAQNTVAAKRLSAQNATVGMSEQGMSATKRKMNTDFGSPWKGLWRSVSKSVAEIMTRARRALPVFSGERRRLRNINLRAKRLGDFVYGHRQAVDDGMVLPQAAWELAQGKSVREFAEALGMNRGPGSRSFYYMSKGGDSRDLLRWSSRRVRALYEAADKASSVPFARSQSLMKQYIKKDMFESASTTGLADKRLGNAVFISKPGSKLSLQAEIAEQILMRDHPEFYRASIRLLKQEQQSVVAQAGLGPADKVLTREVATTNAVKLLSSKERMPLLREIARRTRVAFKDDLFVKASLYHEYLEGYALKHGIKPVASHASGLPVLAEPLFLRQADPAVAVEWKRSIRSGVGSGADLRTEKELYELGATLQSDLEFAKVVSGESLAHQVAPNQIRGKIKKTAMAAQLQVDQKQIWHNSIRGGRKHNVR